MSACSHAAPPRSRCRPAAPAPPHRPPHPSARPPPSPVRPRRTSYASMARRGSRQDVGWSRRDLSCGNPESAIGPTTLPRRFRPGRGMCVTNRRLRRKVDRGLAKYRRGVAEAVLCKYRGLLSAKSPEKITPKAQVALATTKTSQLRSSRTSHRSTRPGNEVAGSLRIQIRNYVIFWRTWHSQQLYCRSHSP